jgi:pro-sigmaK processing inhibitor BofA
MILEIVTGFAAGLLLIALFCWLFKAKMKWYLRFALSSAFGFLAIFLFGLFGLVKLPLNPMNAFVCGFLGVPGLILLILVTVAM